MEINAPDMVPIRTSPGPKKVMLNGEQLDLVNEAWRSVRKGVAGHAVTVERLKSTMLNLGFFIDDFAGGTGDAVRATSHACAINIDIVWQLAKEMQKGAKGVAAHIAKHMTTQQEKRSASARGTGGAKMNVEQLVLLQMCIQEELVGQDHGITALAVAELSRKHFNITTSKSTAKRCLKKLGYQCGRLKRCYVHTSKRKDVIERHLRSFSMELTREANGECVLACMDESYAQCQIMASLPLFFKMVHILDLRCVLLPAL